MTLICPKCGGKPRKKPSRYGVRDYCCGMWSYGGRRLVDPHTHLARQKAHAAFDFLWKSGKMTRSVAYDRLSVAMGLPKHETHIALFDEDQCKRVVALASQLAAVFYCEPVE